MRILRGNEYRGGVIAGRVEREGGTTYAAYIQAVAAAVCDRLGQKLYLPSPAPYSQIEVHPNCSTGVGTAGSHGTVIVSMGNLGELRYGPRLGNRQTREPVRAVRLGGLDAQWAYVPAGTHYRLWASGGFATGIIVLAANLAQH